MQVHIESSAKRTEEVRHEFGSAIRCDMRGNAVLGKYVSYEDASEFRSIDVVASRNEYGLFGEAIDNDKDSGKRSRLGQMLNEIHRYRMPRTLRNRELLQQTVRTMTTCLRSGARNT